MTRYRSVFVVTAALIAVTAATACQPREHGRTPYARKTTPAIGTKAVVSCGGPILNECVTRQDDGSFVLHRKGSVSTVRIPGPCVQRAERKSGKTYLYITMKPGCYWQE